MDALATPDDVEDMWRPLLPSERERVYRLITKASALLRQPAPWVDARMAKFTADPTDPAGLDPDTVSTVVATMVKRFLVNTDGATNISETTGPYSLTRGFALRGDKDTRGELKVTESDLAALAPATTQRARVGSLRVAALLSPPNLDPTDPTRESQILAQETFYDGFGQ